MDAKSPNMIDKHVGRRLRWRRRELKLSQEALAGEVGLTFQQVQKYERGSNRVSAGRLYELAQALETPITYFFEGAEEVGEAIERGMAEDGGAFTGLIDTDAVDLVIAFQSIPDPNLKKSILTMVRQSAEALDGETGPGGKFT